MAHIINFTSKKHGVGTSTMASLVALKLSQHYSVLLVDDSQSRDTYITFGLTDLETPRWVNNNLELVYREMLNGLEKPIAFDFIIVDSGIGGLRPQLRNENDLYTTCIVTDNSYIALSKTVKEWHWADRKECLHICIIDPNRPLDEKDCANVLVGPNTVTVKRSDRVGRMQDASTISATFNNEWVSSYTDDIINSILSITTTK